MSDLIHAVERHWPIGRVAKIERIKRGLVNQTFRIDALDAQSYILRLYHPDVTAERIRNEHELLHRLERVGFDLAPRLIAPLELPSWKPLIATHDGSRHMALMTHLPGVDRYTWDTPPQHPSILKALGDALVRYHQAIQDWRIKEMDPAMGERQMLQRLAHSLATEPDAVAALETLPPALLSADRRSWPALVVHGDFHAANVRWSGKRITGLFDFEYADLNWRLYDVATAIACLAFDWNPPQGGHLQGDHMQAFLEGYQGGLDRASALPGLSKSEWTALPCYLTLAHLLTLEWAHMPGTLKRLGASTAHRYAEHARMALTWLRQDKTSPFNP